MVNFIGPNVTPVTNLLATAMATGQNLILIGDPGNGKTAMVNSFLKQVTNDNYVMVRVESSAPPEKVQGVMDPVAYFEGKGVHMITAGTPYQPNIDSTLIDEIGRANKAVYDILLDVADRWDIASADRTPVVATTNFMPTDEYTRALRDRFPLVYHMQVPRTINMSKLVLAQASAGGPSLDISGLPDISQFKKYRNMTPSARAQTAVAKLLSDLQAKAVNEAFCFNYRRATQMYKILFHVSAWKYDSDDFDECHPAAVALLQYAFGLSDKAEAARWQAFCTAAVDTRRAAADRCRARIHTALTELSQLGHAKDRTIHLGEYVKKVQDAQAELTAVLGDDDPLLDEVTEQTTRWTSLAIQGKALD